MITLYIITLIIYIPILIISLYYSYQYFESKRLSEKINNFEKYRLILEYHLKKAYDIIYKDRILIYSLEAIKLGEKEFSVITKDFLYLVLKMIGPNLKKEFSYLYGSEESLFFNITEYFNTKFEEDEIRKVSVDEMINSDLSEQENSQTV